MGKLAALAVVTLLVLMAAFLWSPYVGFAALYLSAGIWFIAAVAWMRPDPPRRSGH